AIQAPLAGTRLVYGVSSNNNPPVQDVGNTPPAWGFPFAHSPVAPTPAAAPLIDGTVAHQVLGLTAYTLWNQLLYVEAGAYGTLSASVQRSIGVSTTGEQQIDGLAPYWRLVLQREWPSHYVSLGTFGLHAQVFPGRDQSARHDRFTDWGLDASYQFQQGAQHLAGLNATFIAETQHLTASHTLGNAEHTSDTLQTFRMHAYYTFMQTYGATLGYFQTTGRTDRGLFAPAPITGSVSGRPPRRRLLPQTSHLPFANAHSFPHP